MKIILDDFHIDNNKNTRIQTLKVCKDCAGTLTPSYLNPSSGVMKIIAEDIFTNGGYTCMITIAGFKLPF